MSDVLNAEAVAAIVEPYEREASREREALRRISEEHGVEMKESPDAEQVVALARSHERLREERDAARANADGMARAPYGEFEEMRRQRDEAVAACAAAVRAGGNAADALKAIMDVRWLCDDGITDRAERDVRGEIRTIAREALATLEPAAVSQHTEATQQETRG